MRMLNCHVHWLPRSVFEHLCEVWFDLDDHIRHFDSTDHHFDFVCSLGPFSTFFSEIPLADGIFYSRMYNDEMADAQRRHPGRVWASGVVPLQDTQAAVDELDRSIKKLGLIGVNIPGSIGKDNHIDHPRLEPFYERVAQLGVPLFIHPTDNTYIDVLDGYNGALHLALGRTFDVSTTAARLIFSGIMERHPDLKVFMSHTGGALPYQSGRMDKSAGPAKLPKDPSVYLQRFYTDTVSPHAAGVKFAIDFFGVDHIMFGDDYPCWKTETALEILDQVGLSKEDKDKVLGLNARRFFGIPERVEAKPKEPAFA
jgi:aminocarboxymuconate-semialdehyde decarboxylase